MKLPNIGKNVRTAVIGCIFALSSLSAVAYPHLYNFPGKVYLGVFGGIASPNSYSVNQYGTAFYPEILGGPLAVNAFGTAKSNSSGFVGGQIGYQWISIPVSAGFRLTPALELESYYIGRNTFTADDINNNTARLPEHDFVVTYPTETGVFLTNAVFNLDSGCFCGFHPYVGFGFGGAIVSISHANATQVSPPEPGINHFNSNSSDTSATFAGQAKIGLSYDICRNLNMFIDYRWLYLSSTSYAFGSTVFPGHPETSYWQVKMNPRSYNIGAIGIRYSL